MTKLPAQAAGRHFTVFIHGLNLGMQAPSLMLTVLHYTGYRTDQGGIVATIRALQGAGGGHVVHGVVPGFVPATSDLATWTGPEIEGEAISFWNVWRARKVAKAVRTWLHEAPDRVFHGHSRAGLLVALWLNRWRERRVVVSVHCYGRQKWFYRWAARRLGSGLSWLTPAMREYYGVAGREWEQCRPGGVGADAFAVKRAAPVLGRLRLGAAGALVRWKRWDLLLAALAGLPAEIRAQVSLEHIGAPTASAESRTYAEELRRMTETLGLGDCVRWCGAEVSSQRLLSGVDLIVVTSHGEAFSMIIQEAWAAGVAVLAADSGGPRDLVRVGRNGWLFQDGDVRSLTEALVERVRSGDWARLDRAVLKGCARRAMDAAAEWSEVYQKVLAGA